MLGLGQSIDGGSPTQPGNPFGLIGLFIGNGTDALANCTGAACNGGNGGLFFGSGGAGANGGNGGNAGFFGNGGAVLRPVQA